MVAVRRNSELP